MAVNALNYFHQQSSSYYLQSHAKFENELKNFEQRLEDTCQYVSDLRFSDGHCGKPRFVSDTDAALDIPTAKVAQAFALPFLVSLLCGAFLFSTADQPKKGDCEAPVEPSRNILSSRAAILLNPSNDPCEDRFNCYQLKNLDGYYQAVFDGHGGW